MTCSTDGASTASQEITSSEKPKAIASPHGARSVTRLRCRKWKRPDNEQLSKIRKILCLRADAPWVRCPAKDLRRVQKLESEGDFTHRDKDHEPCEKCRCTSVCGSHTYGDFYGIGDTGHYGVGWCGHHERGTRRAAAHNYATNHMHALQAASRSDVPAEVRDQMMQRDAATAESRIAIRREFELVEDTLNEFLRLAKSGDMTEKGSAGSIPISDKSRIELALKIAGTISQLNLDQFKMKKDEYIHIDELKVRIPQMMQVTERMFDQLFEWMVKGKENALQNIKELWRQEFVQIWKNRSA